MEDAHSTVVLVIDDEASVLRLLRATLEIEDMTVFEAMTGPIGLGLIPIVDPEVVVLDVMMPGMDGVEVCSHIAARYPDLPVIILTARDDRELEQRCLAAGARCFMNKPMEPTKLIGVISSLAAARWVSRLGDVAAGFEANHSGQVG